jgi:hypothetical protein
MIEKAVAAVVLAACAALLLRMALPARQRAALDAWWLRLRSGGWMQARNLWRWRARRAEAEREAEDAIRRAQRKPRRDGNVVRPESFKGPRKPH